MPPPPNKKKRADLSGWGPATYDNKLKHLHKNACKGDWRRDVKIHNIKYKIALVSWSSTVNFKTFSFSTPIPVGMEELLRKLESSQNRTFTAIPLIVREEFNLTENNYSSSNFEVQVTFSQPKFGDFRVLYCRFCSTKKSLKTLFWDRHPDKLPEEISLEKCA